MSHIKYKLPNGANIILAPRHDTQAITALVLVKVGSRYETKQEAGISHFIEHLLFKGTKMRPSAQDISRQLDGIGADYNAFTSKDRTGYYIKTSAEKMELCIDILSDIYYNSTFRQEEIDRERNVVIEEINMYEDNPIMLLGDLIEELIFGKEDPLGWSTAGTKQTMTSITRKDIVSYYEHFYRTNNITIVLAGKLDIKKTKNLLKNYFHQKKGKISPKNQEFQHWKPGQKQFRSSVRNKNTEQMHVALGFPSYSYFDKDLYASYVLATILGGNMSSRLFVQVRERRGLAYYVRASSEPFEDTGLFCISAGLDQKRLTEALETIAIELQSIKERGVDDEELQRAKEFIKGKIILDMEDSEHIADWLGRQQLFQGKIVTMNDHFKKIDAVTKSHIQKVAKNLFQHQKANLVIIGSVKKVEGMSRLLEKNLPS